MGIIITRFGVNKRVMISLKEFLNKRAGSGTLPKVEKPQIRPPAQKPSRSVECLRQLGVDVAKEVWDYRRTDKYCSYQLRLVLNDASELLGCDADNLEEFVLALTTKLEESHVSCYDKA